MRFAGSERCEECHGTGISDTKDGFDMKCPVCHGRKVIPILMDAEYLANEADHEARRVCPH